MESHILLILVQGLVLSVVFVLLALLLLRGRSAQAISHYWRTALAGLLIVPFVSLMEPWWQIPVAAQETGVGAVMAPAEVAPIARPDAVIIVPLAEEGTEMALLPPVSGAAVDGVDKMAGSNWRPVVVMGIWALGALCVFGRWAMSWARVKRMVNNGTGACSPAWKHDLARFGKTGRCVRLVISGEVTGPMVFGLWRPVLILPLDADSWEGEERRAVLAHELCHVRRRDALFLLLARVTVAMHWINPLAWLAVKRLRLAEERAADDAVLAGGRDPAEYASLLAGFARREVSGGRALPVVAPSMAGASTVRSRVQHILDARQRRGAPRRFTRFAFTLLVCTVVLAGGGVRFGPAAAQETPAGPGKGTPGQADGTGGGDAGGEMTLVKARQIIIPSIDFEDANLAEAIEFLRLRSRELDTIEPDPAQKGFNFVVLGADTAKRVIPRLQLRNVPLASVLQFICEQTGTVYEAGPFAITIKDAEAGGPAAGRGLKHLPPGEAFMMAKLRKIVVPSVAFEEASLSEAVEFLRQRARELDGAEPDPAKKGVNLVLRGKDIGAREIRSMKLVNVPLDTILTYVCKQTNTAYKVDQFGVTIVDATGHSASDLVTRTFVVPPDFPEQLRNKVDGGPVQDPFAADTRAKVKVRPLVEILRDRGITFSEGASVSYVPATSRLVVRARPQNLDLVARLLNEMLQDLPSLIKLRIELYEVPKADALKIAKHNADKNEGSGAYRMVEALVGQKKATLLSSPTTMVRPGQRGTMRSGSDLEYVAAYLEKDGQDTPVMRKALVGSTVVIEPNMGQDGRILDVRFELTMTRGEPKLTRRTVKAPVSGREVEVESVLIDTLTLKQGLTTLAGQTQFLGMMQSSMHVDNPNEIMAFLTATVTKVMP